MGRDSRPQAYRWHILWLACLVLLSVSSFCLSAVHAPTLCKDHHRDYHLDQWRTHDTADLSKNVKVIPASTRIYSWDSLPVFCVSLPAHFPIQFILLQQVRPQVTDLQLLKVLGEVVEGHPELSVIIECQSHGFLLGVGNQRSPSWLVTPSALPFHFITPRVPFPDHWHFTWHTGVSMSISRTDVML